MPEWSSRPAAKLQFGHLWPKLYWNFKSSRPSLRLNNSFLSKQLYCDLQIWAVKTGWRIDCSSIVRFFATFLYLVSFPFHITRTRSKKKIGFSLSNLRLATHGWGRKIPNYSYKASVIAWLASSVENSNPFSWSPWHFLTNVWPLLNFTYRIIKKGTYSARNWSKYFELIFNQIAVGASAS